jgi:hypothetical protein
MARRRDRSVPGGFDFDGAAAAFLDTDGLSPLFDGDAHWPDPDVAEAAWERCRLATWRHDWRDEVFPPVGAQAWDGLTCTVAMGGYTRERLETDLATLQAHREQRPDLAEVLEVEYGEYEQALQLLLGLAAKHNDRWMQRLELGSDGKLSMVGPNLAGTLARITTLQARRGQAA